MLCFALKEKKRKQRSGDIQVCNICKTSKMRDVIRVLDEGCYLVCCTCDYSLFFKQEMELSLIGLQNSGKTSLVNVVAQGHDPYIVQANNLLEDQSQVESGSLSTSESGPFGTFVGVYDGYGGPETSRFINDQMFQHLKRFCAEQQSMSVDVIRKAFQATEEGFLSIVTNA